MALSDLILNKGEVVVVLSASINGVTSAGVALNFGIVQKVNDLCDTTQVGASVQFDISKAIPFMIISGQIFYRVNEKDISFTETAVP